MDSLGGRIVKPVEAVVERYGHLAGEALLRPLIETALRGRIALVSSFGADAAVLLHMVAAIARATPVIFLDTGKHFGETLRYRDRLVAALGLSDVRSVAPDADAVERNDPSGTLWHRDPARCCAVRKVAPLARALEPFAAWITGRKRFQGGERGSLRSLEIAEGRLKVNPLARWTAADIAAEYARRGLPPHPLVADGFLSIGCMPCTARAAVADDPRSGRWLGSDKSECGIHHDFKDVAAGI